MTPPDSKLLYDSSFASSTFAVDKETRRECQFINRISTSTPRIISRTIFFVNFSTKALSTIRLNSMRNLIVDISACADAFDLQKGGFQISAIPFLDVILKNEYCI